LSGRSVAGGVVVHIYSGFVAVSDGWFISVCSVGYLNGSVFLDRIAGFLRIIRIGFLDRMNGIKWNGRNGFLNFVHSFPFCSFCLK
jgi:hypothetical protein